MRRYLFLFFLLLSFANAAEFEFENPWPSIFHQAGPYGIKTPEEVAEVAKEGYSLSVLYYAASGTPLAEALERYHVKYLDSAPFRYLYDACQKYPKCQFSADEEDAILQHVKDHLEWVKNDPKIAGFWILDDNPGGDIHGILEKIHRLIAESNQKSIIRRPAVCGFGGMLDYKNESSDRSFHSSHRYFLNALENFSASACDAVALYPYGWNSVPDPSLIDWSMSALLPYELVVLKRHGWNPEKEPLIGFAQTFSYPWEMGKKNFIEPRPSDIALQTEAYCKWGASTIIFYAWDDSVTDPRKHELFNSPELRAGIREGVLACQARYWLK